MKFQKNVEATSFFFFFFLPSKKESQKKKKGSAPTLCSLTILFTIVPKTLILLDGACSQ